MNSDHRHAILSMTLKADLLLAAPGAHGTAGVADSGHKEALQARLSLAGGARSHP